MCPLTPFRHYQHQSHIQCTCCPGRVKHVLPLLTTADEKIATLPPTGRAVKERDRVCRESRGKFLGGAAIPRPPSLLTARQYSTNKLCLLAWLWLSLIWLLFHEGPSSPMFPIAILSFSQVPVQIFTYPFDHTKLNQPSFPLSAVESNASAPVILPLDLSTSRDKILPLPKCIHTPCSTDCIQALYQSHQ